MLNIPGELDKLGNKHSSKYSRPSLIRPSLIRTIDIIVPPGIGNNHAIPYTPMNFRASSQY